MRGQRLSILRRVRLVCRIRALRRGACRSPSCRNTLALLRHTRVLTIRRVTTTYEVVRRACCVGWYKFTASQESRSNGGFAFLRLRASVARDPNLRFLYLGCFLSVVWLGRGLCHFFGFMLCFCVFVRSGCAFCSLTEVSRKSAFVVLHA